MKKLTVTALLLALAMGLCGCGKQETNSPAETAAPTETAQEVTAEDTTEAETEPPTNAPLAEGGENACTFDEIGAELATVITDDDTAAGGSLSIEEIDGNKLLKFTDETTDESNLEGTVQKLSIDVTKLLAPEQLSLVNSIEFDLYAEATDSLFLNEDGELVKVPGWIGGGGGTVCADGDWYNFSEYSASGVQEYDLERSDACHVTFKFLLAASGKCWDETMTAPNFLIMRWGLGNTANLYIDNLTFFDADGNSIPLTISEGWAAEDTEEEDADTADDTTEEITDAETEEETAAEEETSEESADAEEETAAEDVTDAEAAE